MGSSAEAFVDEASAKAAWLVQREARGPGDLPGAMNRLSARYGIPYATFLSLRYRKPKDILVSAYSRICAAYEAEIERQKKLLEHEAAIASATTRFGRAVVHEAKAMAGTKDGPVK